MRLSLCFLFCVTLSSLVAVQAGGLKILGGYVDEYDLYSKEYYGKSFEWGQSEAVTSSEARLLQKMYCWTRNRQNLGFCYHRLIVSTASDYPKKEHYQIVGSYQQIYDGDTLLETKFENGIMDEEPPYQKIQVANGKTWCQVTNSLKIGDLFFFVKKTTEPSITDDISTIFVKANDHNVSKEEQFWNCHDSTSVRVPFSEVHSYTSAWKGNTYMQTYFWRAPRNLN